MIHPLEKERKRGDTTSPLEREREREREGTSLVESSRVESSLMLRLTVSRAVYLGIKHASGADDQIFITVKQLQACWCGALSLTGEWVCRLQLPLVLASPVNLGSESRGIRDHILNLEGQVPVFISTKNRVAQVYPQGLGSLFCTSYDSQGYGGAIRTSLHHSCLTRSRRIDRIESPFTKICSIGSRIRYRKYVFKHMLLQCNGCLHESLCPYYCHCLHCLDWWASSFC
jgi:hypothetical protein